MLEDILWATKQGELVEPQFNKMSDLKPGHGRLCLIETDKGYCCVGRYIHGLFGSNTWQFSPEDVKRFEGQSVKYWMLVPRNPVEKEEENRDKALEKFKEALDDILATFKGKSE